MNSVITGAYAPEQLKHRAPTMNDIAAVTGLINICAVVDTGVLQMTVKGLRAIWQRANFNLDTDALLVTTPGGGPVGYVEFWGERGPAGPYVWVHVHPDWRGRGVDALLFAWAEERTNRTAESLQQDARMVLHVLTVSFNQAARRQLHRHGFRLAQRFWRLAPGQATALRPVEHSGPACAVCRTYIPEADEHVVCRYDLYEKELWAGAGPNVLAAAG